MKAPLLVLFLMLTSVIFGGLQIALSLYSAVDKKWTYYKVPKELHVDDNFQTHDRYRGLLIECAVDSDHCDFLEGVSDVAKYPNSNNVLRLRSAAPALAYCSIIIAALAYTLGGIAFAIFRNKPRRRQAMLLLFGAFAWLAAIMMFCCVVVFLECRNQEAYTFDHTLATLRTTWSRVLQRRTVEHLGEAYKFAIIGATMGHIGSFSMMAASVWA